MSVEFATSQSHPKIPVFELDRVQKSNKEARKNRLLVINDESDQMVMPALKTDFSKPQLTQPSQTQEGIIRSFSEAHIMLLTHMTAQTDFTIRNDLDRKQELHQKRVEHTRIALDKMKRTKKSGLFAKILGWLATAASFVIGGILIASGAGALAGGLMISGALLSLTNQVSGTTGNWLGNGVAKMFESFGVSEDKSDMAAQMTIGLTSAMLSIGGGIAMVKSAAVLADAFQHIFAVSIFVSGLSLVGRGGADMTTGIISKQAKDKEAQSLDVMADIKLITYYIEENFEFFQGLIENINETARKSTDQIRSIYRTKLNLLKNYQSV